MVIWQKINIVNLKEKLIVFNNGGTCAYSTAQKKIRTRNVNKNSLTIWHSISQKLVIGNCMYVYVCMYVYILLLKNILKLQWKIKFNRK